MGKNEVSLQRFVEACEELANDLLNMDATGAIDLDTWVAAKDFVEFLQARAEP